MGTMPGLDRALGGTRDSGRTGKSPGGRWRPVSGVSLAAPPFLTKSEPARHAQLAAASPACRLLPEQP